MTKGFDPSFPFYCNDWLSSSQVCVMTKEEQADYIWLLCHCWASQDASLIDDDAFLARLSRQGDNWLNGSVRKQFSPHPLKKGYITNLKMFAVWQERQAYRAEQQRKGQLSAKKRKKAAESTITLKERVAIVEEAVDDISTALQPRFNHGSTGPPTDPQPKLNSSSSSSLKKNHNKTSKNGSHKPPQT